MAEPIRFPSALRRGFLEDHARLRRSLRELERLAESAPKGAKAASELSEAAQSFRRALDVHNRAEEAELETILRDADSWGEVRHERMLIEHLEEHRDLHLALAATDPAALARAIAPFAQRLRDHMDDEERTFLSAEVLRDDVVSLGPAS